MTQSSRQIGIDVLRIVSMFLVVILHVLGAGGILNNVEWMSGNYFVAWFLEILAYCAVNAFALISGYVGGTSKFYWSRILKLWLQVVFYTIIITLIYNIFASDKVTTVTWIKAIFPISTNQYWYMTAYTGMFFFIPFMNIVIEKIEKKFLDVFFFVVLVFFCLIPCVLQQQTYGLSSGYSMIWLIILYLLGAYIKKYDIPKRINRKKAIIIFFISTIVTWLSKIVIEQITFNVFGKVIGGETFISYISPTIIVSAIALLCFFANTNFESTNLKKVISLFSNAALGVYIIHLHPLNLEYLINNSTKSFALYYPIKMVLYVIGFAIGLYFICSLIELCRLKLFKLLNVNTKLKKFDSFIDKKISMFEK